MDKLAIGFHPDPRFAVMYPLSLIGDTEGRILEIEANSSSGTASVVHRESFDGVIPAN